MFGLKLFDHRWRQVDFERHSGLECGQQPCGLLWIIEHQRLSNCSKWNRLKNLNDREYGSTEPFPIRRTTCLLRSLWERALVVAKRPVCQDCAFVQSN